MNKLYKAEFVCYYELGNDKGETSYILNIEANSLENAMEVVKNQLINFLQLKYSKFGYINILKSESELLLVIPCKVRLLLELVKIERF